MLPKMIRASLLLGFVLTAVAQTKGPILRLSATSDNVSGAGDAIKVDLLSWSTDADRDQLVSAWMLTAPAAGAGGGRGGGAPAGPPQTPESSLAAALQTAPTAGILWTSESTGYSIHYAYRIAQPDGGQRIILATDRRLGVWNNLWKPVGNATPTN